VPKKVFGVPTGTAAIQYHQWLKQKWDTESFHRIIRLSIAGVPPTGNPDATSVVS
jgi:hypothetical protein